MSEEREKIDTKGAFIRMTLQDMGFIMRLLAKMKFDLVLDNNLDLEFYPTIINPITWIEEENRINQNIAVINILKKANEEIRIVVGEELYNKIEKAKL